MRTVVVAMLSLFVSASLSFAQQSSNIPSEVTLFKNVKIFDGVAGELKDLDVLVVKNKIHRVAEAIPETGTW